MNILDKIIEYKRTEVAQRKAAVSVAELEKGPFFSRPLLSLKTFLTDATRTGIIAEFKRRSPSKGVINDRATVAAVTGGYTAGGASCLSVLTDGPSFGGSTSDLQEARVNQIPILRKDFIIDEYQIVEARSMGADVILLIAACLSPAAVQRLARSARSLGLEVLLEIHGEDELGHIWLAGEKLANSTPDITGRGYRRQSPLLRGAMGGEAHPDELSRRHANDQHFGELSVGFLSDLDQ